MKGVRAYSEEQYREYRNYWLNMNINEAFNRTCDTHPEKEALVEGEKRLTFSQVSKRVQKAALAFLGLGLGKESLVLFHMPNWIETVYAYMGLTAIGAVPVLLLPRHGKKELEHFCGLTEAAAWIGPARYGNMEYLPMVKGLQEQYIHLRHIIVARDDATEGTISLSRIMEDTKVTEDTPDYLAGLGPSPDDVLHLGPTGGTTGLSKLVPRTHNAHLIRTDCFIRGLELGYGEVTLPFGPMTHEGPHCHNFCSWILFGGKLILNPSIKAKDLLEQIGKEGVTYFFAVPALVTDILNDPDLYRYDLSSVSLLFIGGGHAGPKLIKAARDKLKTFVCGGYGSTEGARTIPRPYDPFEIIANTSGKKMCPYDTYKMIDDEGKEMPVGQEGEIVIRGPSVFTGYYKAEEEDRLVFSPDGFYYTGDIGKFDPYGNIIITGRKKDIIRRGAESISALEVEAMVVRHPKVLHAAAVGMPDSRLGERICVYLQLQTGEKITFDDVISFLKDQGVSTFLLPERIEVFEELPRTAMDKVDKKKLKEDITNKLKAEEKI